MSEPAKNPPPGFDSLSTDERIDYIQTLWDYVSENPENVPIPEWHKRVLEQRIADHEKNPDDVIPWEEVRERMKRELGGSGE